MESENSNGPLHIPNGIIEFQTKNCYPNEPFAHTGGQDRVADLLSDVNTWRPPTHTYCSRTQSRTWHTEACVNSYPWGQLCTPPNTHVRRRYKRRTNRQMNTDRHRQVYRRILTHAGSQYWEAPQIWHPLDPSRGHLKGLKTISPSLFLFYISSLSLPLPPSFCPRFGLCPDSQSHWWLCFQLSQPLLFHHRITSSCSVGNIQESRADEPKEMFWESASIAKPNWDRPQTGPKSGKKNYEWMVLSVELQKGFILKIILGVLFLNDVSVIFCYILLTKCLLVQY